MQGESDLTLTIHYKHNLHIVHSIMQRPREKVRELHISVVIILKL